MQEGFDIILLSPGGTDHTTTALVVIRASLFNVLTSLMALCPHKEPLKILVQQVKKFRLKVKFCSSVN